MNIQHREAPAAGAGTVVGRIAEIWRYPVQSMGGERLTQTALSGDGVPGDREYGIVDPGIGEVVSAAQGKKKWRGLVTLSARLLEAPASGRLPPVEIVTPEGETLRGDQQNIDERLSAILGQPVHLAHRATENKRSSYSHEPLHILTTASMAAFKTQHKEGQFAPARFRPNLVIDTGDAAGYVEQAWLERLAADRRQRADHRHRQLRALRDDDAAARRPALRSGDPAHRDGGGTAPGPASMPASRAPGEN